MLTSHRPDRRYLCPSAATLVAMACISLAACDPGKVIRDLRSAPATEHERYGRALVDASLDSTVLGRDWLAASDSALRDPLDLPLPAREVGAYAPDEARAVAYRLEVREGQRLQVRLRADGLPVRIYLDLFQTTTDTGAPFEHRATATPLPLTDSAAAILGLEHEADRDGIYVLRLQPELLRRGRFELSVTTGPSLAFPVEGRGNAAIQSFFGVARDGGARQHAGIDIFAPRGTPVLASTPATVRSTTPNNLGGTVVWLTDQARNQSLYYAHLDRQIVSPGQRVAIGDTIGFVGNTGNARTTPPHLHFGIYRRGRGAVDPLPHVRLTDTTPPTIVADTTLLGAAVTTRLATINLRSAPTTSSTVRQQLSQDEPVRVMGAQGDWLRVQLDDGTSGYLVGRAVTRTTPRRRGRA